MFFPPNEIVINGGRVLENFSNMRIFDLPQQQVVIGCGFVFDNSMEYLEGERPWQAVNNDEVKSPFHRLNQNPEMTLEIIIKMRVALSTMPLLKHFKRINRMLPLHILACNQNGRNLASIATPKIEKGLRVNPMSLA